MEWRFLRFNGDTKQVVLDRTTRLINQLPELLGIFRHIVDASLAALDRQRQPSLG